MPFSLTNTPTTFQLHINTTICGILNKFYIIYLNDILIYSQTEEEHERHITKVLIRL